MADDPARLEDRHGRVIRYARVSLTGRCDFRCPFCRPGGGGASPPVSRVGAGEYVRLCALLRRLGVVSFKITGGEPFMNPSALDIVRGVKALPGGARVTVTTNGATLKNRAAGLAEAGADGVNVSLNAVSREGFQRMSGSRLDVGEVMEGIEQARRRGLDVKLNMVPVHGMNSGEIVPVLEYARRAGGLVVRFIELMPIGAAGALRGMDFNEVRRVIEARFGPLRALSARLGDGPSVYYRVGDGDRVVGSIASLSRCFCHTCDRVRLTSSGFLRTCLHSGHGVDLLTPLRAGADDAALAGLVRAAVAGKPGRHGLNAAAAGALRGVRMFNIGG